LIVGLPDGVETYTHRIGRTGRADASGEAWIVLAPRELVIIKGIEKAGMKIQKMGVTEVPGCPEVIDIVGRVVSTATKKLVDDGEVEKLYQAWLGYYTGRIKILGIEKKDIVEDANLFVKEVFGCELPPKLEKKTVGKMGLKGVPGLRFK
jgi:ATP-dependent RNA helicase MSS116